jgi:hypothetical protein
MNKSNGEAVNTLNKRKSNSQNNVNVELTVLANKEPIHMQAHVLAQTVQRIANVMRHVHAEKNQAKNKEFREQNYQINHKNN